MTRPTLTRHIGVAELTADADGRTVDGLIIPWDSPAEIYDTNHPDHPDEPTRYYEAFSRRALDRQIAFIESRLGGVAKYVAFNLDHSTDLGRQIGYARELSARETGGHATFRLYERADLDHVRSMLTESHTGLSVEFHDYNPVVDGDLVIRRSVNVVGVAATPTPAYADARVASVRGGPPELPELATPRLDEYRKVFG